MLRPNPCAFKVLVVEDETSVQRLIVKVLKREGYRVTAAATGKEALERCESEGSFHLLLTDINLPDGNGRELARELRKRLPQLCVILCSGDHEEGSEVLFKPFSISQLRSRVEAELIDRPGREVPPS